MENSENIIINENTEIKENTEIIEVKEKNKICTRCDKILPVSYFYTRKTICTDCYKMKYKEKYITNKDKIKEQSKKKYKNTTNQIGTLNQQVEELKKKIDNLMNIIVESIKQDTNKEEIKIVQDS